MMNPFDIEVFMRNVRKEARESDFRITPETRSLVEILRLSGEDFIMAAYRRILLRDADPGGLQAYLPLSKKIRGKIRILKALYSSIEFKMCHAVNGSKKYNIHYSFFSWYSLFRESIRSLSFRRYAKKQNRDEFYFLFENKYREDFSTIYERMEMRYAHILTQVGVPGNKALDLGCGRGEFVALLTAHGFSTLGVDRNPYTVAQARKRGLDIRLGDIFAYLRTVPSSSLSIVTAFHVIEHISFEQMWTLLTEIYRVLHPEGLLILETPNIRNILVSSGDFYRDPTHVQHVFPETLDFLLSSEGFEGTPYFFSEDQSLIPVTEIKLDTVHNYVDLSRDMAWVGHKK